MTPLAFNDGVSIVGFFRSAIGLGESARRQLKAVRTTRYPASAHNIAIPHAGTVPFDDLSRDRFCSYPNAIVHINPPEMLYAGMGLNYVQRGRHYVIGYWHWELPVFPPAWAKAMDLVDEIWAPTQFGADVNRFANKPVHIVPHAVPLNDIDQRSAREALNLPLDRLIFLTTFDTSSFPDRKNPEAAVRAMMDAFQADTDSAPLFVVKLHGSYRPARFTETLRRMHDNPLIKVIDETLSDEAMRNLQAACDCFISLHRSEGFGFNMAECMAAGRPVIATDFSGNRDFMKKENSLPIPYSARPVGPDEYIEGRGQWWAEPDHDAAVEAIRWVVDHPSDAAELGRRAKQYMATNHSFERIGLMVVAALGQERRRAPAAALGVPLAAGAGSAKIGRNDPCPCGSGKKYKNCHGGIVV